MIENNYINEQLLEKIAKEQNVKISQIDSVLKLIEEGGTVPFIARYRKEVTGNLDEEQIRAIYQEWDYGQKLAERKEAIMRLIEEKGKLTEEIKDSIIASEKLAELEDIYRPYKEKKKTRAIDAKNKGLEPFAEYLLTFPKEGDVLEEAAKYVTVDIENTDKALLVASDKDAIQGAQDIIAEIISDNAKYRKWIRGLFERDGILTSVVKDEPLDEKKTFEMYYEYTEPVDGIKLHRVLAINRGESEKILRVSLEVDQDRVFGYISRQFIKDEDSIATPYVRAALEDAYKRLIKPSIEREVRSDLKEKAEDQAIRVFSVNLKSYLLTPPMKGKVVLGVDPAYRTGCKLAVVDETGKVLEKGKIYPNEKSKGTAVTDQEFAKSEREVIRLINQYDVSVIAIGNGTASRETESFIADVMKKVDKEVNYIIVNEAGASIYSASEIARDEFPDYSVEERSAVSIARRLQDPLSELVKIDPKSIGVGQYQYDVSQAKLGDSLNFVVSTAVNSVGVDINTASVSLLERVAGLNSRTAKSIVKHRDENGAFENRKKIDVKGIGPKTLEQAIGFLRITEGDEKLDMTAIHPESYAVAEVLLERLGFTKADLGTPQLTEAIKKANRKELIKGIEVGDYTFNDILDDLMAPLRDPRDTLEKPLLRSDVLKLDDLIPGMELQGVVRNIVDFGAFIDCGVKEDGLVHISKICKGYIKHPLDKLSIGQIVKVWVVSINAMKGHLELSMLGKSEE